MAFSGGSAVRVRVDEFNAQPACQVVMHDATTGDTVSYHSFKPGDAAADLPTNGHPSVYLSASFCGVSVSMR